MAASRAVGAVVTLPLREEIRAMVMPAATYRRLLEGSLATGWRALVPRPALIALLIGSFVTLGNAGELLPTLLLGSAVAWSWVPLLQMAIAAPMIAVCRRRRIPVCSALDLFFVGHGPWSLWLLAITLLMMWQLPDGLSGLASPGTLVLSGLVPILWTCFITLTFSRTVLGLPAWLAAAWTLGYQAAIWSCAYFYVGAVTFRMWPFSLYGGFLP